MGMKVYVDMKEQRKVSTGVVRFIGRTTYQKGYWVGVELPSPFGDTNGALRGHAYFLCRPNHGVFVRGNAVSTSPPDVEYNTYAKAEVNFNTSTQTTTTSTTKPNSKIQLLSNALKVKLTKTMDVLNQQLELAELLETDTENDGSLESLKFDIVQMLNMASLSEGKIQVDFKYAMAALTKNN
jgi:dynactin complex subunit